MTRAENESRLAYASRWFTHAERNPEACAVLSLDDSYSYAQLGAAVEAWRQAMRSLQVEVGDRVAVATGSSLQTYAAILAVWGEGAVYVPVDLSQPAPRIDSILQQADCRAIIAGSEDTALPELIHPLERVSWNPKWDAMQRMPPCALEDDQLAYILFTSGSTGQPKGVPIRHGNLNAFFSSFEKLDGVQIRHDDRVLQMFSLTFDLSIFSLLSAFAYGATLCPVERSGIPALATLKVVQRLDVTHALMVPSVLGVLKRYFSELRLPSLRVSLFCGEPVPLDLVREWDICLPAGTVHNVYGPTEATIFCTHYAYNADRPSEAYAGILTIGTPMPGTEVRVLDEARSPVAHGTSGDLYLLGGQLSGSYWNSPEKTSAAYVEIRDADGSVHVAYRTGDRAHWNESGTCLLFEGRTDHQVKIQGYRVELGEIENGLRSLGYTQNAVLVIEANGAQHLVCYVVCSPVAEKEISAGLATVVPAYMVPKKIFCVDELPLSAAGKIDRVSLRKQAVAQLERAKR